MRLQWDDADPCRFREIMEYTDRATYEADQRRVREDPEMIAWLGRWHALLDGDLTVRVFEEHDLD